MRKRLDSPFTTAQREMYKGSSFYFKKFKRIGHCGIRTRFLQVTTRCASHYTKMPDLAHFKTRQESETAGAGATRAIREMLEAAEKAQNHAREKLAVS